MDRNAMNIVVLGGSRFFGKRLVRRLAEDGHDVTVATRGRQQLGDLEAGVRQTTLDRSDWDSMKTSLGGRDYDVVYDQIGFNPHDAKIAVDLFAGRVNRFVFTSTMAVYDGTDDVLDEQAFDAKSYPVDLAADRYTYKEGKRQAEAYLAQNASFPVVSVRPPFVISSDDDYTGRFAFHVQKLVNREPICLAGNAPVSFVSAAELADFLEFVGTESDYAGAVNASNTGWLDTEQLVRQMAGLLNVPAVFDESPDRSPYCTGETLKLSNALAQSIGFSFLPVETVIERLVREMKQRLF